MIRLFLFWVLVAGALSSDFEDDRRMPPFITPLPKRNIIFKEGDPVKLPCSATGIPNPTTFEWYRNDERLQMGPASGIHQPNDNDGLIRIDKANKYKHDGKYQCKATNKYGTDLSTTILLNQTEIYSEGSHTARKKTVKLGEPFSLEPFTIVHSTPKALYNWKTVEQGDNEDPVDVTRSRRIALDKETGILYFANAQSNDQLTGRVYKLDAMNAIKDEIRGVSPYDVTVEDSSVTTYPIKHLIPQNGTHTITGLLGRSVILKCFFGGLPTPSIKWDPPSGGPPEHRIDCTQESQTECHIEKLQYSDEGPYRCTGQNDRESKSTTINLVVEATPTFDAQPVSINITEGKTATFLCRPKGKPPAEIEWFSNGQKIDVIENPRMNISEDRTNLTVTSVCKDCEGTPKTDLQVFQCRIFNKHGDAFASAYLNVLLPTVLSGVGLMNTFILNVTDEWFEPQTFRLSCNIQTDSLLLDKLDITWQMNGKKVRNGHPYLLQNNDRHLVIKITENDDNFLEYMGMYRCIVKSPYARLKIDFNVSTSMPLYQLNSKQFFVRFWWLLAVALFLIVTACILITGVRQMQGNEGGQYLVYDNEIKDGNNPDDEVELENYHEYKSLHFSRAASKCSLDTFVEI